MPKSQKQPHMASNTKTHVLNAGKELLLAAQGALSFCKHYVETSKKEKPNPEVIDFFSKALEVAEDLAKGFVKPAEQTVSRRKHATKKSTKTRKVD